MLLKGKEVAEHIDELSLQLIRENHLKPTLALFKAGDKEADLSYQKGILKKCEKLGINIRHYAFSENVEPETFFARLQEANTDPKISGILVLRPLPAIFDDEQVRNAIALAKDVDGCSDLSLAGVFTNRDKGFAPCTAQAVMALLEYYKIPIQGKRVVIIGRSLVIGKPLAMLMLNKDATVTIVHSKSGNIPGIAREADILVSASGQLESINKEYVNEKQTVIDVGIGYSEAKQKLCGDVLFEEVEPLVSNITPVPGGVGAITTSILLNHVVVAGMRR